MFEKWFKKHYTMITRIRSPFLDTFSLFEKLIDSENEITELKFKTKKNENGYNLLISVPGLTKDDIKISVTNGVLKISLEKESEFVGKFEKTFTISNDVNVNKIEGKVENGVLILNLPFKEKEFREKLISLN